MPLGLGVDLLGERRPEGRSRLVFPGFDPNRLVLAGEVVLDGRVGVGLGLFVRFPQDQAGNTLYLGFESNRAFRRSDAPNSTSGSTVHWWYAFCRW